jgi:hypothetical protein
MLKLSNEYYSRISSIRINQCTYPFYSMITNTNMELQI